MIQSGTYGVLNIVAHPHPEGIYRKLFTLAGENRKGVRFFGERFASTSPISETRNGVFTGRIATWTEIDENSNLINKSSLIESLLADSDIPLPTDVGFNSRVFSFAFRESDHQLFVELRNDERQSISIGRIKAAFSKVLQEIQPTEVDELLVHFVTKTNAVENVLAIPSLRKIMISLVLPNPDDLSDDEQSIIDSLNQMNAKKMATELTKSAGADSLSLTRELTVMANLAKDNGFVKGIGKDENGEQTERNTNEYPFEIDTILVQDESRALATRRIAETHRE